MDVIHSLLTECISKVSSGCGTGDGILGSLLYFSLKSSADIEGGGSW